jgi:hypothetical protein
MARKRKHQRIQAVPDCRATRMTTEVLLKRAARRPVTVAFLMEANTMAMREASVILFGLERDGLLTRTGGEPGTALLWHPTGQPRVLRAIHSPAGA